MIDTARFEGLSGRIAGLLPAAPESWHRVTGGHSADPKWRIVLTDGRSVFAKVATDRVAADTLRYEHALYAAVDADFLPRLMAWDADDPPILVVEALTEAIWPPPFPAQTAPLFAALGAVAATSPPDVARAPPRPDGGSWWSVVAAAPRDLLALELCTAAWLDAALPVLERAERGVDLNGDELVHGNVFADNLCFAPRGVVLVDWSDWFRGDARFDVACALLALRREGALIPPVTLDDEAGWAALLAGLLAVVAVRPPPAWIRPASGLRDEQVRDLEVALRWCRQTLDLPPLRP